jgi:hypothetical protein
MAKKVTKKTARATEPSARPTRRKPKAKPKQRAKAAADSSMSAADAVVGLLRSPLVADILAVGAAAALAAIAQQGLTKKKGKGVTRSTLRAAATAAAAAISERMIVEFHDLVDAGKSSRR